jgi:GNAT superfamily N-acetyltransferase
MTLVMIHTANYMTSVMVVQGPSAPPPVWSGVQLVRSARSDTEAVLAMLARCSRASLFHRFHGFTDGVAYFAASLRDRPVEQTLLAWYRSSCVGVADLGVDAAGTPNLGVLVEDGWQRRGVGTRLAASLLDSARAKGLSTVHADVLGDDRFILQALRRIAPLRVSIEFGTLSIDIDLCSQPGPLSGNGLPFGMEATTDADCRVDPPRAGDLGRRRGVRR